MKAKQLLSPELAARIERSTRKFAAAQLKLVQTCRRARALGATSHYTSAVLCRFAEADEKRARRELEQAILEGKRELGR